MTPRWLGLGPEEIAELRGQSGVQMLTEWLEWERDRTREIVLAETVAFRPESALLRSGASITIDHILKSLRTPTPIATLTDDEFTDPARRPSRKDDAT
jgi:hypothetical protein